jgi:pilus assembly protein Flp/PilA
MFIPKLSLWQSSCINGVGNGAWSFETLLRRLVRRPKERGEKMLTRFFEEEDGQTLVEYGLLVSLIALVVIAVLTLLGRKVQTVFNVAQNAMRTS